MAPLSSKGSPGLTRTLLTGGILAGPVYVLVGLIEGLARPGFSFLRHSLSLLANGDWVSALSARLRAETKD